MASESVPFEPWRRWWTSTGSAVPSVMAGAVAGLTTDAALHPLDTFKTRLQSAKGFRASGGFAEPQAGLRVALLGSVPCKVLWFGTFEALQVPLRSCLLGSSTDTALPLQHGAVNSVAAGLGYLVASVARVPVELFKKRLQIGATFRKRLQEAPPRSLLPGWSATVLRDVTFGAIQYPLYHVFKSAIFGQCSYEPLDPWQSAFCGSMTSMAAAIITTPFDVAQTRIVLSDVSRRESQSVLGTLRSIVNAQGYAGLFAGATPRALNMGLGGLIFLGSYEQARLWAIHPANSRGSQPTAGKSSPGTAFLAGGSAGIVSDVLLHPVDTFKTRAINGTLKTGSGMSLQEIRALWRGLDAAILPTIPASATFFVVYEAVKSGAESSEIFGGDSPTNTLALNASVAAAIAETTSCVVRVPAEQLKMRMQAKQDVHIAQGFRSVWARGGVHAMYKGLGATILLDVPFSLIQLPLFETLKHGLKKMHDRGALPSVPEAWMGAMAGGMAGAIAGMVTTPLDVVRTRHVLQSRAMIRSSFMDTVEQIWRQEGIRAFSSGMTIRTIYLGLGGMSFLGTYSACSDVLVRFLENPR